jgi:hypothetical protein
MILYYIIIFFNNISLTLYYYLIFFTGGVYMNSILPDFFQWWSLHEPNFTYFFFLAEFTVKKRYLWRSLQALKEISGSEMEA